MTVCFQYLLFSIVIFHYLCTCTLLLIIHYYAANGFHLYSIQIVEFYILAQFVWVGFLTKRFHRFRGSNRIWLICRLCLEYYCRYSSRLLIINNYQSGTVYSHPPSRIICIICDYLQSHSASLCLLGICICIIPQIGDSPTSMIYGAGWAQLDIHRNSLLFIFTLRILMMKGLVIILYGITIMNRLEVIGPICINFYSTAKKMICYNICVGPNLSLPYF